MNEAHAEVDDMGNAAKKERDAENKKKLDEINGKTGNDGGAAGEGTGAQQPKKPGDPDILKDAKKPTGTISQDADEFLGP